ncbi:MAG: hypothetical protein KJ947_11595 [Alphaproteobacteria bacterium]|nr:hypothetical protein [Alphaproteobacteria bacterium]MBU2337879.1 hypothetical protein [Alphaproteobacteria bacterium]MBU2387859.1 hypothetical protein [Alphaproteobacteria bacterium]
MPKAERAFLADCFDAYLDAQGDVPLDRALGLRKWGGVSVARAVALSDRDGLLINIWQGQTEWRSLSPLAAARMMKLSADRYESGRWPRERDQVTAPAAEPAATWWRILQSGVAIPDVRRLQQILTDGGTPPVKGPYNR